MFNVLSILKGKGIRLVAVSNVPAKDACQSRISKKTFYKHRIPLDKVKDADSVADGTE